MVGMMNGDEPYGLEAQFEAFRRSDQQREALVQDIVCKYEQLRIAYREKCDDYEDVLRGRRYWQTQAHDAIQAAESIRQSIDSNPFVLVLVDGDGAIFQDALLKEGSGGGSDAAHKLLTAIRLHVQQQHEGAGHWAVMVQVYANVDGLARKLSSAGVIGSPQDLYAFVRAFSMNQPLFGFIDVGSGKERVDHKIKEMFRLFISNRQCKHIIFAGCHDSGYVASLDSYKHDFQAADRVTLLETTPAQPGFASLDFATAHFPSVFRSERLPERPAVTQAAAVVPPARVVSHRSNSAHTPHKPNTSAPLETKHAVKSLAPPSSPRTQSMTWAAVGKAGTTEKQINIATKKFAPRKAVLLNSMDQRIDPVLPRAEKAAVESLNARIARKKVCNEYHLIGKCQTVNCPYEHGEKLSSMEQLALRHKARSRSCPDRSHCRNFDCIYGHCCPNENCYWDECYFRELHAIDKRVAYKMHEDGTTELVNGSHS